MGLQNSGIGDYYLREVRYWNRALTAAEIQDDIICPKRSPANGLEAYFPMTKRILMVKKGQNIYHALRKMDLDNQWGTVYEIIDHVVFLPSCR